MGVVPHIGRFFVIEPSYWCDGIGPGLGPACDRWAFPSLAQPVMYCQMRTIHIDCSDVRSVADVWQRYLDAAAPDGGETFGRNLDAFWDAVEGGGPGWPGAAKLVFVGSTALAVLRLPSGLPFLPELRRIANEATRVQIEFA